MVNPGGAEPAEPVAALWSVRLDPSCRRLDETSRRSIATEFRQFLKRPPAAIDLRLYLSVGLTAEADALLWVAAPDLGRLQDFASALLRTHVAPYLLAARTEVGVGETPAPPLSHLFRVGPTEAALKPRELDRILTRHPSVRGTTYRGLSGGVSLRLYEAADPLEFAAFAAEAGGFPGLLAGSRRSPEDLMAGLGL